jgi:DNA-binding NtrC family response regulator
MEEILNENNPYYLLQIKYGIVGNSKPMRDAMQRLMQAAPTDLTVLITGETGTGKEVFANALHGLSKRRKFPFISVNCGAIPETLLESELFGHEKGAFTGAIEQRKGFFEVANKGTIFLDEIGELPLSTQVKLLRVLESGEFTRLGSTELRTTDVRVVTATNRELDIEVKKGTFRQDLFFRLNSVHIILPPLRQHIEDLPLLIDYFGNKVCNKLGLKFDGISSDALGILRSLPWQGNIRELRNMLETMITLENATYIDTDLLRKYIARALPPAEYSPQPDSKSLIFIPEKQEPKAFEFELILRSLLELTNEIAEIKRTVHTMNNKLEKLGIDLSDYYSRLETPIVTQPEIVSEENLNLAEIEKNAIAMALKRTNGNRRMASLILGISERTLYRKIDEYGLDKQNL